jgi:hypothetical protein
VLRHLVAIRSAIAGEVTGHTTTEGVRAALSRLFDGFTLHHWDSADAPRFVDANLAVQATGKSFLIESHLRPQVVEGWHGGFVKGRHGGFVDRHSGYAPLNVIPVLKRVPVPMDKHANTSVT